MIWYVLCVYVQSLQWKAAVAQGGTLLQKSRPGLLTRRQAAMRGHRDLNDGTWWFEREDPDPKIYVVDYMFTGSG